MNKFGSVVTDMLFLTFVLKKSHQMLKWSGVTVKSREQNSGQSLFIYFWLKQAKRACIQPAVIRWGWICEYYVYWIVINPSQVHLQRNRCSQQQPNDNKWNLWVWVSCMDGSGSRQFGIVFPPFGLLSFVLRDNKTSRCKWRGSRGWLHRSFFPPSFFIAFFSYSFFVDALLELPFRLITFLRRKKYEYAFKREIDLHINLLAFSNFHKTLSSLTLLTFTLLQFWLESYHLLHLQLLPFSFNRWLNQQAWVMRSGKSVN